jgi:hypothetical protein
MSKNNISKWDNIRRTQMGYMLNTILALSLAFLGYLISFITHNKIIINYSCFFKILLLILVLLIIINLICSLVRLIDFRKTARKNRDKDLEDISYLGRLTWFLFYAQLILFIIEIILFLTFVFINFNF